MGFFDDVFHVVISPFQAAINIAMIPIDTVQNIVNGGNVLQTIESAGYKFEGSLLQATGLPALVTTQTADVILQNPILNKITGGTLDNVVSAGKLSNDFADGVPIESAPWADVRGSLLLGAKLGTAFIAAPALGIGTAPTSLASGVALGAKYSALSSLVTAIADPSSLRKPPPKQAKPPARSAPAKTSAPTGSNAASVAVPAILALGAIFLLRGGSRG